jgi:hypothetical protein
MPTALHVHYAAQNPRIIFSLRPRLVDRQMLLDPSFHTVNRGQSIADAQALEA